ncbi:hypothetical protein [Aromatoleum aromaticum]|nr:hypothetical protein [Aromatoleum aromaticum]
MKTWVFLRGLTRESGHWGGFLETFACIVPDSRIVVTAGCKLIRAAD